MAAQTSFQPETSLSPQIAARSSMARLILFHIAIFLTALLILFLRRPDALLNAQFYAEDGERWFADAYHFGWRCLLLPESGYLQSVSRLIALFCQLFPLAVAPLVMNLFAFFFQILPVNLFLSSRFAEIPFKIRIYSALLYLSIPNSFETHANTTNIQWRLGLACCLILISRASASLAFRSWSWLLLALSVLDGPAGVLLTPVALVLWWARRDTRSRDAILILIPGTLLQGLVLLLSGSRRPAPNGATVTRLVEILGGQVFLSSILGVRTSMYLFFAHVPWLLVAQAAALALGLAVIGWSLLRGPFELKLFVFYAYLCLAVALIRPVASFGGELPQWQLMEIPGAANRYYFLPMLAFLSCLIWAAGNVAMKPKLARYTAISLLALLPIGVARDWSYKPFIDYDFKGFAAQFEQAAPGTKLSIPINPDRQLVLVKHQ